MDENEVEVTVKEEIGFGGFAKVFLGEISTTKERIALKAMKYNSQMEKEEKLKEIKFLKELRDCPGVINIIASRTIEDEKIILMALELMEKDLYEFSRGKALNFNEYFPFFQQLSFTLAYMQKRGIQHRDLKSKNILVNASKKIVKLCDFGVAVNFEENVNEVFLAGTTRYMAPEILKMIQDNNLERLGTEAGSEKILKPYIFSRVASMEDLNCQFTRMSMIQKIRNATIKLSIQNKYNVTYNSNFLADVFSLGLNILESFGVGILTVNVKENRLKNALKEFKNKMPNKLFYKLTKSMLTWEENNRPDFIQIEDYLLYTMMCPLNYYIPFDLRDEIIQKNKNFFVSKEAFEGLNLNDGVGAFDIYFFSKGWKCIDVPIEYQRLLEEICKNNCGASIQEIQSLVSSKLKKDAQLLLDILSLKDEPDLKKLIKAYSLPTELFQLVNNTLAKNEISSNDLVKAFTTKLLEANCKRGEFDFKVNCEYVYRGIGIGEGVKAFVSRVEYLPGMEYCWPAFSSTSKNELRSHEFFNKYKNKQNLLFKIKLNLKNQRNKLDISSCSIMDREEEVLLLPYFRFRVISNTPKHIAGRNVCLVEIHEQGTEENLKLSEPKKLLQFVWVDRNIKKGENDLYLSILSTKYSNEIKTFTRIEDAVEFVKNTSTFVYIISSGEYGEQLFKQVHGLPHVIKAVVFCYNIQKHSTWATNANYPKLLGVFNDFFKLNKILINPFY